MVCRFREIKEGEDAGAAGGFAQPFFVNCNDQCRERGLVPSKNPRACHLCGEGSVLKLMRCSKITDWEMGFVLRGMLGDMLPRWDFG